MRTPNLLPAEMLLQMLLSGRLAGRAWRLGLPQCRFRAGQHACTISFSGRNFVFGEVPLDPKSQRNSSNCGDGGVVVLVTSLRPLQLRLTSRVHHNSCFIKTNSCFHSDQVLFLTRLTLVFINTSRPRHRHMQVNPVFLPSFSPP